MRINKKSISKRSAGKIETLNRNRKATLSNKTKKSAKQVKNINDLYTRKKNKIILEDREKRYSGSKKMSKRVEKQIFEYVKEIEEEKIFKKAKGKVKGYELKNVDRLSNGLVEFYDVDNLDNIDSTIFDIITTHPNKEKITYVLPVFDYFNKEEQTHIYTSDSFTPLAIDRAIETSGSIENALLEKFKHKDYLTDAELTAVTLKVYFKK